MFELKCGYSILCVTVFSAWSLVWKTRISAVKKYQKSCHMGLEYLKVKIAQKARISSDSVNQGVSLKHSNLRMNSSTSPSFWICMIYSIQEAREDLRAKKLVLRAGSKKVDPKSQ
eukprot:Blabericola_migrator_1__8718@NODE_4597_length_1066_cov_36_967968_g2856_i0_p1_GENE_NODE_4597_length_1066_cov_36_967968_g2856_i0NODE_4597_length_1066_cov_36_967968_g2856_i0_p1_ORF_typecomplete_len115_score2_28DUF4750/PF15938_5/0_13_NODE_4597_length_1066_cov_36_967968_g2856_i0381725